MLSAIFSAPPLGFGAKKTIPNGTLEKTNGPRRGERAKYNDVCVWRAEEGALWLLVAQFRRKVRRTFEGLSLPGT